MTLDDLWRTEEAFFNAWPAERNLLLGGFLLRSSGGPSRRVNSLNPLRGAAPDPRPILPEARRILAALGRPVIFRAPSMTPDLDAALDALGAAAPEARTLTLAAGLGALPRSAPCEDQGVSLARRPGRAWRAARAAVVGGAPAARIAVERTLGLIAAPARFATARIEDRPAAVAVGVLSHGLLLIEAVATAPEARRRGLGRAVTLALMRWGAAEGAKDACLQVLADNGAALRLYRQIGFARDLYAYHYRRV